MAQFKNVSEILVDYSTCAAGHRLFMRTYTYVLYMQTYGNLNYQPFSIQGAM
jgi:hypothetical protein